jgi:hypothetical protein
MQLNIFVGFKAEKIRQTKTENTLPIRGKNEWPVSLYSPILGEANFNCLVIRVGMG